MVTWCLTENQLTENQLTENQLTENQLTENQLTENQLTENHLTENQLTENHLTENQLTENHSTENQLTENRLIENQKDHRSYVRLLRCKCMLFLNAAYTTSLVLYRSTSTTRIAISYSKSSNKSYNKSYSFFRALGRVTDWCMTFRDQNPISTTFVPVQMLQRLPTCCMSLIDIPVKWRRLAANHAAIVQLLMISRSYHVIYCIIS